MKFFATAAALVAAASSVAGAAYPGRPGRPTPTTTSTSTPTPSALCLDSTSAAFLTNGYGSLLTAYSNATANAILSTSFTDTSDSINWLAGIPLGGFTFSSLSAFIAGQGTQPPIGFSVTEIMFSCTEVAFRWVATVGLKKWPVKGINMFTATNLNNTAAGWQIQNMYSEFNVGAWEIDIGRTCSPQGANIAGSA